MVSHRAIVRGPSALDTGGAPSLLATAEQDFVSGLLVRLRDPERGGELLRDVKGRGELKKQEEPVLLHQPVHRMANLVLVELCCDVPGTPRLDPARVHSAGLVLRRANPKTGRMQAWLREPDSVRGWQDLPFASLSATSDPDPEMGPRSAPRLARQHPKLVALLGEPDRASEATTKLFAAPPDVMDGAGATLYYGLVPLTSDELVQDPPAPLSARKGASAKTGPASALSPDRPDAMSDEEVDELLPAWLRAGASDAERAIPWRWQVLSLRPGISGASRVRPERIVDETQRSYYLGLQLVFVALTTSAERERGPAILDALEGLSVTLPDGTVLPWAEHILEAGRALVYGEPDATVRMPVDLLWPQIDETTAAALRKQAKRALQSRLQGLVPTRQRGRFEDPESVYRVRAFVRVLGEPGCPPHLYWSSYSHPFRIAPWYEPAPDKALISDVQLPPIDRDLLKRLRPNVTFRVPKVLFNVLKDNAPDAFIDGSAREGGGSPDFDWICGFNIPIITLCAFIVLFIFLALLNIIFWWLPFVKICIPFPRSLSAPKEVSL